jgi:hypothetical protein
MFRYFITDRVISFEQLKAIDWSKYDIQLWIDDPLSNGLPSATLIFQETKILVRVNHNGDVSHFIPIDIEPYLIPYILNVIGHSFHVGISTEYDGPYLYIKRELEESV